MAGPGGVGQPSTTALQALQALKEPEPTTAGTGTNPLQGHTATQGDRPTTLSRFKASLSGMSASAGAKLGSMKASIGRFFSKVDTFISHSRVGQAVADRLVAMSPALTGRQAGFGTRGYEQRDVTVDNVVSGTPRRLGDDFDKFVEKRFIGENLHFLQDVKKLNEMDATKDPQAFRNQLTHVMNQYVGEYSPESVNIDYHQRSELAAKFANPASPIYIDINALTPQQLNDLKPHDDINGNSVPGVFDTAQHEIHGLMGEPISQFIMAVNNRSL